MEQVLVSKEHIVDYIPQKHPIVMIDTLNYCDEKTTKTTLRVRPDNIFIKNGYLHEPGIIENMAQTAAVKVGYEVKKLGAEPLLGFIGAIKDLEIHYLPKLGEILSTTVTIKMDVMGVTLIEASSNCGDKQVASCEMKIFIQKPEAQSGA